MSGNKNIKIAIGYIIELTSMFESEIEQFVKNFQSFADYVDKIYIYNATNSDHSRLYERFYKYHNIEFCNCSEYGEAEIVKEFYNKSFAEGADFAIYIKPGYFYEEGNFLELKKYLIENDTTKIGVLTPMPLLACETHERKAESHRFIKGCRLIGAFVNLHIYKNSEGIDTSYYRTTFDYDYCLKIRQQGYYVTLASNQVLRNQNYKVINRKIIFISYSAYDRDLLDIYYETRGRHYLWEKFKKIDKEYVKLDKKLYKQEKKEMRVIDKNYRDKKHMYIKGVVDYKEGIKGKYREY